MPKRVKIKVLSLGNKFYSSKSEDPWVGQNFVGADVESGKQSNYVQFARDGDIELEEGKFYEGREAPSKRDPDKYIFDQAEELDESLEPVVETPFQKRHTHSQITKAADANNKSIVTLACMKMAAKLSQDSMVKAHTKEEFDKFQQAFKSITTWLLAIHDELVNK